MHRGSLRQHLNSQLTEFMWQNVIGSDKFNEIFTIISCVMAKLNFSIT